MLSYPMPRFIWSTSHQILMLAKLIFSITTSELRGHFLKKEEMTAVSHRHIFRYLHMNLQSSLRQTFLTSSASTFTSFIQKQQDPVQNNNFTVTLLNNRLQWFLYSSHFSHSNMLLTAAGN